MDESTDFLAPIYKPIKNKTVIIGGSHKSELMHLIPKYDRVIMMGHGSPNGLYAIGIWWDQPQYIIDESFVPYLRGNPSNMYIWCHADQFVDRHGLSGLCCGMFISSKIESIECGVGADHSDIEESNSRFVEILASCIEEDSNTIHKHLMEQYRRNSERNPVVQYNHKKLYCIH